MKKSNVCILGAGWAGLLTARRLQKSNYKDITLIESLNSGQLGGLLKSVEIDGFTFDCGGPHILFSRNSDILSEITGLLKLNAIKKIRNNFVYYKNKFIPYPFENGIYQLMPEERVKIVSGIIHRMIYNAQHSDWYPSNFLDWIVGFFGDEMAKEYLIPYNEKIWKRPLDKIAVDWVFTPGRLPFPDLENMLLTVAGIENTGYREQSFFFYPKSGGISALYNSLLEDVSNKGSKILTNLRITNIKINKDKSFNINDKVNARNLVSTIPLPELLLSLDNGIDYKDLAMKFDYNRVIIVGIAIKGKTPSQTTVYVPDPRIIFHRYTWMSALIPPKNSNDSNLIVEITVPKNEKIQIENLKKKVFRDLLEMGIVNDENSILFTRVWVNTYGYPIYSLNHNEIRDEAMKIIGEYGIKSVGRWGSWHYWNTDMVYKAVNEIQFNFNR